jgi:hypothetical protein
MIKKNEYLLIIKEKRGYIALFSTIIMSAVFLLLFSGMFLLATGGMSRVSDMESSLKASSWANTCIEEALNSIRNDPNSLITSISYDTEEGGCLVENVVDHGNEMITFDVVGEFSGYSKTVQISVAYTEDEEQRLVEITGWSEEI